MKEPKIRNDTKGKWRHLVPYNRNRDILTNMSWDTRVEAELWIRWNSRDDTMYGKIVKNPDLLANPESV